MAYYAPFYRPMGYYNASMPQENINVQGGQAQMQQPFQQIPIMQTAPTNDMLFVLNETEATAYPVAPNNSVTLWDKNQPTVYIKSVNMQGVPSMRILDYTERNKETAPKTPEKHVCQCGKDFVKIEDFKSLQGEFEALKTELADLKAKPKAKTKTVKEETEDGE